MLKVRFDGGVALDSASGDGPAWLVRSPCALSWSVSTAEAIQPCGGKGSQCLREYRFNRGGLL